MKRIAVITSGGDAPGMNPAIRAIVRKSISIGLEVFGVKRGLQGLMDGDLTQLRPRDVGDIMHRGGTILGTARAPEFLNTKGQQRALATIEEFSIDGIIMLGGDGSFHASQVLHEYGKSIVCIPTTIDNDIGCTEVAIGVDTALNTVVEAMNKLRDTAASHDRTFVIETMGRNCGYLALMAGLAGGAEAILIPEVPFEFEDVANRVMQGFERGKRHSFIIVSEGIHASCELRPFQSVGEYVGALIADKTGLEVRVTVLGHVQRGGAPSAFDRLLSTRLGVRSVEALLDDQSGVIIALQNGEIVTLELKRELGHTRELDHHLLDLAYTLSE